MSRDVLLYKYNFGLPKTGGYMSRKFFVLFLNRPTIYLAGLLNLMIGFITATMLQKQTAMARMSDYLTENLINIKNISRKSFYSS